MNILGKVTWKTMWKNRTRTIVTIIGVILASAMFTAVTTMGTSLRNFLIRGNVFEEGDYYVQFAYAPQQIRRKRGNGTPLRWQLRIKLFWIPCRFI